jgi:hypothetical protein
MAIAIDVPSWNTQMKAFYAPERDLKYSLLAALVLALVTYSLPVS